MKKLLYILPILFFALTANAQVPIKDLPKELFSASYADSIIVWIPYGDSTLTKQRAAYLVDLKNFIINGVSGGGGTTTIAWDSLTTVPAGFADNVDDVDDADASIINEIQTISLSTNTLDLSLSGGSVNLSKYLDNTDAQDLSLSNNQLSISGGTGTDLSALKDTLYTVTSAADTSGISSPQQNSILLNTTKDTFWIRQASSWVPVSVGGSGGVYVAETQNDLTDENLGLVRDTLLKDLKGKDGNRNNEFRPLRYKDIQRVEDFTKYTPNYNSSLSFESKKGKYEVLGGIDPSFTVDSSFLIPLYGNYNGTNLMPGYGYLSNWIIPGVDPATVTGGQPSPDGYYNAQLVEYQTTSNLSLRTYDHYFESSETYTFTIYIKTNSDDFTNLSFRINDVTIEGDVDITESNEYVKHEISFVAGTTETGFVDLAITGGEAGESFYFWAPHLQKGTAADISVSPIGARDTSNVRYSYMIPENGVINADDAPRNGKNDRELLQAALNYCADRADCSYVTFTYNKRLTDTTLVIPVGVDLVGQKNGGLLIASQNYNEELGRIIADFDDSNMNAIAFEAINGELDAASGIRDIVIETVSAGNIALDLANSYNVTVENVNIHNFSDATRHFSVGVRIGTVIYQELHKVVVNDCKTGFLIDRAGSALEFNFCRAYRCENGLIQNPGGGSMYWNGGIIEYCDSTAMVLNGSQHYINGLYVEGIPDIADLPRQAIEVQRSVNLEISNGRFQGVISPNNSFSNIGLDSVNNALIIANRLTNHGDNPLVYTDNTWYVQWSNNSEHPTALQETNYEKGKIAILNSTNAFDSYKEYRRSIIPRLQLFDGLIDSSFIANSFVQDTLYLSAPYIKSSAVNLSGNSNDIKKVLNNDASVFKDLDIAPDGTLTVDRIIKPNSLPTKFYRNTIADPSVDLEYGKYYTASFWARTPENEAGNRMSTMVWQIAGKTYMTDTLQIDSTSRVLKRYSFTWLHDEQEAITTDYIDHRFPFGLQNDSIDMWGYQLVEGQAKGDFVETPTNDLAYGDATLNVADKLVFDGSADAIATPIEDGGDVIFKDMDVAVNRLAGTSFIKGKLTSGILEGGYWADVLPDSLNIAIVNDGDGTASNSQAFTEIDLGGANVIITGDITLDSANDVRIITGSGTPEAAVTAGVGSTFHRTDGGASTSFYVKESGTGNTGWIAK